MSKFCMQKKILGQQLDLPFGVAPVAMQKLINPEGEVVAAK